jgi:hypothetical protein
MYFYLLREGPAQVSSQGGLLRFVALHGGASALFALLSCTAGALTGKRFRALRHGALSFLTAAFWGIAVIVRIVPILSAG